MEMLKVSIPNAERWSRNPKRLRVWILRKRWMRQWQWGLFWYSYTLIGITSSGICLRCGGKNKNSSLKWWCDSDLVLLSGFVLLIYTYSGFDHPENSVHNAYLKIHLGLHANQMLPWCCKLCHDLHVVQTMWAKWRIISPGIGAKIKNRDFLRPMEVVGDRRDLTRFGPETLFGDYVGYFLQEKKVF